MQAADGDDMHDPAALIQGFDLRIQSGAVTQEHGPHDARVFRVQAGIQRAAEHTADPVQAFPEGVPVPVRRKHFRIRHAAGDPLDTVVRGAVEFPRIRRV